MKLKSDKQLLIIVIILVLFGILMIYSSSFIWSEYKYNDSYHFAKMQGIFFLIGLIIMFIISKIDYHYYYKYSNIIIMICALLLILVLIPGVGKIRNGSRSWFGIGSLGVQPSEFTKIGLIIYVSKYITHNKKHMKNIIKGVFPILGVIAFFFFLLILEPDFGTGMVLIISLLSIIFISGVNISFFVKAGLFGLLGLSGLIIIAPYRIKRIVSFINPWLDPLGSGYQIIQSLYAIGPAGLLGRGLFNSIQKYFYLPEPQTDFIFSIISEELGFLGVLLVSLSFIFIFYRSILISIKCKDIFGKLLAFGLSSSIIIQASLNLMVVVGLIPVTGITLPFLSYGGSSLLVSMTSIGIILNISRKNS